MSGLGKNGIFSNISLIPTSSHTRQVKTYTKKTTVSRTAVNADRRPASRTAAKKRKSEADIYPFDTNKKSKTAQKKGPLSTDLNITRNLPAQFVHNGQSINNPFQPSVQDSNTDLVIAHFSSYSVGSTSRSPCESNLIKELVRVILKYGIGHTVVGCIAWLSNKDILNALQKCGRVLLIVNREDYTKWGNGTMLDEYKKLPKFNVPIHVAFSHLNSVLSILETNRTTGNSKYSSVRAFGNAGFAPGRKGSSGGLEHCKYLVFFENRCFKKLCASEDAPWVLDEKGVNLMENATGTENSGSSSCSKYERKFKELPTAVWTGSMNMTKASETNHENAIFIKSSKIALGYFHDFANTFMVSTPATSCKNKKATPSAYLKKKK